MLLMMRMVALVNMKKQGLTLFPLIQCGWINNRIIGSVKQFVVGSWLWNYLNIRSFILNHENMKNHLNSSTFRLNMPAKDKAVVKCVASILVTTAMSSWILLLIIIKLWQTSFWQSEDVVIKQQEPPMAPVNMIFNFCTFCTFHYCLHRHISVGANR